ncbi:MAG: sigma-70 family RNA polymerase sigma factor [Prolixibacteraceae bacterium]|jgi:RNA polymerase sigma-70 factor (ECF subfamily)|nr:sigma-70 family RNA polymerase sigma factor [Prolixibacteraceae bacterium]
MNDTELISQILDGNMNAFTFLVNRYQKLVVHISGRLIQRQDELEDVCQEVFIKVYQNLGKYRNECKLSTWIATIAYNSSVNYLRKFSKFDEVNPDDSIALRNLVDFRTENYETTDLKHYIREQIELLPIQYRTVVTLFHLEEFSYQEVEQITGMAEGTVKSYLFRAKALLREKLKHIVDENSLKLVKEISNEKG